MSDRDHRTGLPYIRWRSHPRGLHDRIIELLVREGELDHEMRVHDLVHLADEAQQRRGLMPGEPALIERWGATAHQVRKALADPRWRSLCEERKITPRQHPRARREPTVSASRADREPTVSQETVESRHFPENREPTVSGSRARREPTVSASRALPRESASTRANSGPLDPRPLDPRPETSPPTPPHGGGAKGRPSRRRQGQSTAGDGVLDRLMRQHGLLRDNDNVIDAEDSDGHK